MTDLPASRGAVMQFEFDRPRMRAMTRETQHGINTTRRPYGLALDIMRGALQDVIDQNGTLVIVVSDEKITVVQRPDAEEIG